MRAIPNTSIRFNSHDASLVICNAAVHTADRGDRPMVDLRTNVLRALMFTESFTTTTANISACTRY